MHLIDFTLNENFILVSPSQLKPLIYFVENIRILIIKLT